MKLTFYQLGTLDALYQYGPCEAEAMPRETADGRAIVPQSSALSLVRRGFATREGCTFKITNAGRREIERRADEAHGHR